MTSLLDQRAASCSSSSPPRSVLIVDDHRLMTQGLSLALRSEGLEVHTTTEPDADLVMALARVHRPALALVDLQFGAPVHEGLHLVAPLARLTSVLVLTGVTDRAVLGRCLEEGAVGVATKGDPFERLLERIHAVVRGDPVHSLRERQDLLAASRTQRTQENRRLATFASLSPRESEVLELLANGFSADAIAARRFVSVATVRTHIQAILRKLDVSTQLAAVALAHQSGWTLEASG